MWHWFSFFLHVVLPVIGSRLAIIPAPPPPSGYGVWGGGNGPQGLSNSPGLSGARPTIGNTGPLPPYLPPKSINRSFRVLINATGVPQPLPAVFVQSGAQVSIRAHNGTIGGNTDPVYVGLTRDSLLPAGAGDPITPDTEIAYPVDSVGSVWLQGLAGDGVVIAIRATGFGG